jgi:putative DNA primase/helicase
MAADAFISVAQAIVFEKNAYPLDQIGYTNRLEVIENDKLRFCIDTGKWHICEGGIWKQSTNQQAVCAIEDLYQDLLEMAKKAPEGMRDQYLKAARTMSDYTQSSKILSRLAGRKPMIIRLSDLDMRDYLMVVGNGAVDLRTGEITPINPKDFHSLFTTVNYVKGAKAPQWEQFLNEIFPNNPEVISFLQRAVGMSLFGNETETFFICYGEGANGKSVFIDTIKSVLQLYGEKAAISSFVSKTDEAGKARSDIVRLAGRRLITASENKKAVTLDSGLIKEWTGDKDMVARALYSSEIRFEPRGTLWFLTNHKPIIDDDSEGTWRRCRMVFFDTTIPVEKRVGHLTDIIVDAESEGVLAWAIQGAIDFYRDGLQVPQKVLNDTNTYKEEQLPAIQFVRENYEQVTDSMVKMGDVMMHFSQWLREQGADVNATKDRGAVTKAINKLMPKSAKTRRMEGMVFTNLKRKDGV